MKSARSKDSAWPSYEKTISSRSVWFKTVVTSSNSFSIHFAIFSHFIARCWASQKHMPRLLTIIHVLVQRSLRYMRGIHCKYINLVYIYMFLCYCAITHAWRPFQEKTLCLAALGQFHSPSQTSTPPSCSSERCGLDSLLLIKQGFMPKCCSPLLLHTVGTQKYRV